MRYAKICDVGKVREVNQDAIFCASKIDCGLFAVADGMGGYSLGEKASEEIVRALGIWWKDFASEKYGYDFKLMMRGLIQTVENANQRIYQTYNGEKICGSTVVILFLYRNVYGILCAGDSRIYLYYKGKFRQLTVDDVWENQVGLSDRERISSWEHCHGKLVNAVGVRKQIHCRMVTDELKDGMVFLLCSDGLYKFCSEQYIKKCMKISKKEERLEYSCVRLRDKVYEGGAKDNVSIVLVRV
jgi:serine/threonine protein phosphatase PrpC